MSKKCENFLRALDTLCREHGVVVATSGYDSLQVWRMGTGEDPIYSVVEDMIDDASDIDGQGPRRAL